MRIYGFDFTSVPSPRKPITYAQCKLDEKCLSLERLGRLGSFDHFEQFLRQPGPWVAAMDFPFGQPRRFVENIGWPQTWDGYVRLVAGMTRSQFVDVLATYCNSRNQGDKHHLRLTDRLANSRSPMMLYRVPVGKMFFEGSPRLLNAGVRVLPCCVRDDPRIVVEGYPALVARRWIGKSSYKSDVGKDEMPDRRAGRKEILDGLRSTDVRRHFGFDVRFNDHDADIFIEDRPGDQLDALLCAIQAGWAYSQRDQNFGIPTDCDPLEGWIIDPGLIIPIPYPQ